MPEGLKLQGPVHVTVREDISLEQLQTIIANIVGYGGCRACGILGIDLRLSGDPVEANQIAKLPGVKSVGFSA
jgi:hypothetical protein